MKYKEINALERKLNYVKEFLYRSEKLNFMLYRMKWNYFPILNIVRPFPLHIDIEVTDACNLRCVMCVHGQEKVLNAGFIDKGFAKKCIKEASGEGVYSIKFNWRGEAALYEGLSELIRYAKECGIREVQINTNGLPFSKDNIEDIIESGLDRIIFSVDANSENTYKKIRVGGDFKRLVENIECFIETRNAFKRVKPFIRVQMVRMKENKNEVKGFIERWKGKADDIRVTDVTDRGQGGGMTVGDQTAVGRRRCPQPWLRMVINREGLVMPCCSDWFSKWVIGDAKKESLKDIWQSEKMFELRRRILRGEMNDFEPCKSCFVKESYLWAKRRTKHVRRRT